MVPVRARPVPASRVRPPWWSIGLAVVGLAVPAAVLTASLVPSTSMPGVTRPYAIVPSDAIAVAPRIEVTAVDRYEADGAFFFVTIREPELDTLTWWAGRGEDPLILGLTPDEKFGQSTPSHERQRNRRAMNRAKNTAQSVALRTLGYDVEVLEGEAVVDQVVCLETDATATICRRFAPADEFLDPDDHIVEVDGVTIEVIDDVTTAIGDHLPGDVVSITVERSDVGMLTGEVELIASPDEPQRTIVGFVPYDTRTVVLPFDVAIDTDGIGGPSAGLAFTLTLIDELTEGELTGGLEVAVTGTIAESGAVGPIGGLVQKTEAVVQAGADVFIVPSAQSNEQLADARAVAGGDVRIIPVATVEEALAALADLGGNSRELGQPGVQGPPT